MGDKQRGHRGHVNVEAESAVMGYHSNFKKREKINTFLLFSYTKFGSLLRRPQETNEPFRTQEFLLLYLPQPLVLPMFLMFPF